MAGKWAGLDTATLRASLSWPALRGALIVAAVVGTILNGINQGPALWSGLPVAWWPFALTYCVPFFVSLHGTYMALARGAPAP